MDFSGLDPLYLVRLQTDFGDLLQRARDNNHILCIPSAEVLRDVHVDENFVETHILCPSSSLKGVYVSSKTHAPHGLPVLSCTVDDTWSWLEVYHDCDCDSNEEPSPPMRIKILGKDLLLSHTLDPINLLLIDSCLTQPAPETTDSYPHIFELLPTNITSATEADEFFGEFLGNPARTLINDALRRLDGFYVTPENVDDFSRVMKQELDDLVDKCIESLSPASRNAQLTRCVRMASECLIMRIMHDRVFNAVCEKFSIEDKLLLDRATEFCKLRITADQLGARIEFSVPLPAAVVELASLDCLKNPMEKLQAMRNSVDLVIAEVKRTIVEAMSNSTTELDFKSPIVTTSDLLPLVAVVLIKAKPLHLASNSYYSQNFCWSQEDVFYALKTIDAAKNFLQTVRPRNLRRSQTKITPELSLAELMLATGKVNSQNRYPENKEMPDVIYDHHIERITSQIEASTRQLSQELIKSPQLSRSRTSLNSSSPTTFLSPSSSVAQLLSSRDATN
ncbi:unnamed protein product [Notodromas monacha]|uniref:VPS9 domain-containing protein n=1 Tax=Notodromas monacha TaxID=399045 RepID=A0A7R9GG77_9CRUS|nr:unnamed protein product [Notodromas monacha]CAG0919912.1 unnamed protein product [Notodromas monacha]